MAVDRERWWFLPTALIAAFVFTAMPLPGGAATARPDWVALVLVYAAIFMPQRWILTTAMIAGLLLDALQGTPLGQYALALAIAVFGPLRLHLRLSLVPVWQSMSATLVALALYQFVLFWCNGATGNDLGALAYLVPVVTGTLAWPVLVFLLDAARLERRPSD
ncbi:MAG: rod shape-determining protein MreD [Pseudomonadota bacterium]